MILDDVVKKNGKLPEKIEKKARYDIERQKDKEKYRDILGIV